jgi:Zn-dependent protease/predicted transcriptional regulator
VNIEKTKGGTIMPWSFTIGKIFGITFKIHVTFFLLLLFVFFAGAGQGGTEGGLLAALFVCAVFACVLIHEIGHSLIARHFGKEAKSITLLPIGGVATIEEMSEKPGQEIAISIIGPFINLAIAGILYILVGRWTGIRAPNLYPSSAPEFFGGLIGVNIMLAIFNLIPAFPMDGGRVLRGLLALGMDYVRATSATVFIGQVISMLFVLYGIFFNWWLALIGFFIYMGAGAEKQQVMVRSLLHQVTAADAMTTDFRRLGPDDTLAKVVEHVYHGCQDDFPVMDGDRIAGILTRNRLLGALHENSLSTHVSEIMEHDFVSVNSHTPLDDVYQKLMSLKKTAAAVFDGDQLRGMICHENLTRYLTLRAALRGIQPEAVIEE